MKTCAQGHQRPGYVERCRECQLEWKRARYAAKVAGRPWRVRRRGAPPGPAHPLARLSADEVRDARRMAADGWTCRELAAFFRVSATTIVNLVARRTYREVA